MNIPSFQPPFNEPPGVSPKLLRLVIIMCALSIAGISWYLFG